MSEDTAETEVVTQNDQLVLISGQSTTGKSASLMNIRDQEDWVYLNCEAGKRLPFRNKFDAYRISDPWQVYQAFNEYAIPESKVKGVIIDTSTFLMDMFESQFVVNATNTQKAWGDYAQYWKNLLQVLVVQFERPVIILAHTKAEHNEQAMRMEVSVPIKGALKNNGIEAYFSTVVSTKREQLKDLQEHVPELDKNLLHINEDDELLGFKHVFQTRLTKKTVGERIRSPMGLFGRDQTYMDNDAQLLLDHLEAFYR